jgi:hypothetical protein
MGTNERWFWFEWICRLRDTYRTADHAVVASIDEVLAQAEQMLVALPGATDPDVGSSLQPGVPASSPNSGPFVP